MIDPVADIKRAQKIRLFDIFFIGPILIIASFVKLPKWMRLIIAVIGIGTIIYNAIFYFRYKNL